MRKWTVIWMIVTVIVTVIVFSGCSSIENALESDMEGTITRETAMADDQKESTDFMSEEDENIMKIELINIPKFIEEEGVREIGLFADFIDGTQTAYDKNYGRNMSAIDYCEMYLSEYNYDYLETVQFYAEDLDNDDIAELLMLIMYHPDEGDLLVFHSDTGELTAWEPIASFFYMRVGDVYLLEDGTFEFVGGYGIGHNFKQYKQEGQLETVWNHSYWVTPTEDNGSGRQGNIYKDELRTYQDGVEEQYLECSVVVYDEDTPQEEEIVLTGNPVQFQKVLEDSIPKSERKRSFYMP